MLCYNFYMKPALDNYAKLKICVAVSGGRDSMALLHYLRACADEYGITLCALNCDHSVRGEASLRDSVFVKEWCAKNGVPLKAFVRGKNREGGAEASEAELRAWRLECYRKALKADGEWSGADAVATAHHLNDNAETVLFKLARGGGLSSLTGITDTEINGVRIIRPLIGCTRAEIDEYIKRNNVPFVDDETNFTQNYTRNKIRLNVLPELENAVHGAAESIFRFSRLAAEDEAYINSQMQKSGILSLCGGTAFIKTCGEKPLFARAAVSAVKDFFARTDYSLTHIEALYKLQTAQVGKRFEFLGLCAYKEEGKLAICNFPQPSFEPVPYKDFTEHSFGGARLKISDTSEAGCLKFDPNAVPETAVIRAAGSGDKIKKFGGGTKSLGDFFTDKKIPLRLRKTLPLLADGNEILAVCGVEISDRIKVTENTRATRYIIFNINL